MASQQSDAIKVYNLEPYIKCQDFSEFLLTDYIQGVYILTSLSKSNYITIIDNYIATQKN